MNARKVPSKLQVKGEKAGEWGTLWFVGVFTFIIGLLIGGKKAIQDNVIIPDIFGDDDDE